MSFARKLPGWIFVVVSTTLPAAATPPDVINLRNELFGISTSHVFVLRSTQDNLGLHIADRSDTLLVALDLATGAETLWPVYSVSRGPADSDTSGETSEVVMHGPKDSVNPFAILTEYQAVPIEAAFDLGFVGQPLDLTLTEDSLTLTYPETGAVYRLDGATLQSGLTGSVNRVADTIEDYDRFAPVSTRSLLVDRSYDRADCTASDPRQISALIETPPVQLVRVTCTDEDGLDETSFFVVVPPAAD